MKTSTNTITRNLGPHLLLLGAMLLSGCQGSLTSTIQTTYTNSQATAASSTMGGDIGDTYPVDPLFQELYTSLGGKARLGPAISPVIQSGDGQQQYVEAGLLVFDPLAPNNERYRLAPLGLEFDIEEPLAPDPKQPGEKYTGEHVVEASFLELYEALGGARYVGLPLTDTRYNPERHRTEQYFENLGFFRPEEEPGGEVRLMAYGAYACNRRCRYQSPNNSIPGERNVLLAPFDLAVRKIGWDITGRVLAGPSLAEDGRQEVIFENLVLVLDRNLPGGIKIQPMVEMLGIVEEPLVEPQHSSWMVFIEISDGKGHNVPKYFMDFINRHGGLGLFGLPISEVRALTPGVYQQFFANIGLELNLNRPEGSRLSLIPIGSKYKEQYYQPEQDFVRSQRLDNVKLVPYETITALKKNQSQIIVVAIYQDGIPLRNREPILVVEMPDGSQLTYRFLPTDSNGNTSFSLPPINVPPRTMIVYRVCLVAQVGHDKCVEDNFMIWN